MLRSLLVPLDGSAFGEHALPTALSLARLGGAELQLAHVHQMVPPATIAGVAVMDNLELRLKKEEMAYLEATTARVKALAPELTVTPVMLEGDVAGAIQERVASSGVDLVVLSTHGRGALGRFWLGSVADELVRVSSVPVLLSRPHEAAADLTKTPTFRNILLPLDGTPLAEQILEPALKLGGLLGSEYTLVKVVRPAVRLSYLPEGSTLEGMTHSVLHQIEERQRHLEDEARSYLETVADRLRQRGATVHLRVVVDEQPAVGILREAEVHKADLIALETHGRRGLSRLLLGSVADKVLRGATVPVLLQRPVHP